MHLWCIFQSISSCPLQINRKHTLDGALCDYSVTFCLQLSKRWVREKRSVLAEGNRPPRLELCFITSPLLGLRCAGHLQFITPQLCRGTFLGNRQPLAAPGEPWKEPYSLMQGVVPKVLLSESESGTWELENSSSQPSWLQMSSVRQKSSTSIRLRQYFALQAERV